MAVVKGTALFADVFEPNYYDENKPKWQVKLVVDEETAARLHNEGLQVNIKHNDRKGSVAWEPGTKIGEEEYLVINFKRYVDKKKGSQIVGKNSPPKIVDAKRNPFHLPIGNGSTINVQYQIFQYNNKFGKGNSSDLLAIQVLDYIAPPDDSGDEFEEEDGFVASEEDFVNVDNSDNDVPF